MKYLRGIWLNVLVALLMASAAMAAIPNISGFNTRASGDIITSAIWNNELGGIYTYINNNLVTALNTLTTAGDIFVFDGTNLAAHSIGAANNGDVLTVDTGLTNKIKWAAPGGTGLTTSGDTLFYNGGNQRLAVGTAGQVLTVSGGLPSWQTSSSGIPQGAIFLWFGSVASIPSGYALCDGQVHGAVTAPNLQGVFVAGAGNVSPAATSGLGLLAPGAVGGNLSHAHINNAGGGSAGGAGGAGQVTSTVSHVPRYQALCYIIKL